MFFEILKAIFFGIVEGITEWLPVSSTGHLILVQEFINFSSQNEAFMNMFNIVIQLGAILAVMVIYFDKLNPFRPGKSAQEVRLTWQLWAKVVIAILPAMIFGLNQNSLDFAKKLEKEGTVIYFDKSSSDFSDKLKSDKTKSVIIGEVYDTVLKNTVSRLSVTKSLPMPCQMTMR